MTGKQCSLNMNVSLKKCVVSLAGFDLILSTITIILLVGLAVNNQISKTVTTSSGILYVLQILAALVLCSGAKKGDYRKCLAWITITACIVTANIISICRSNNNWEWISSVSVEISGCIVAYKVIVIIIVFIFVIGLFKPKNNDRGVVGSNNIMHANTFVNDQPPQYSDVLTVFAKENENAQHI